MAVKVAALACLIFHIEVAERGKGSAGQVLPAFRKVQFKINFRLVKVAKRLVIAITQSAQRTRV